MPDIREKSKPQLLSKEDFFKKFGTESNNKKKLWEKADAILGIAIKNLLTFSPILDYFLKSVEDFIYKQEKENMDNIVYSLYKILHEIEKRQIDIEHLDSKLIYNLTKLYLDKSIKETQEEKIRFYENLLFHGLIINDRLFDEKLLVWNAVSDLTFKQIEILIFSIQFYKNDTGCSVDVHKNHEQFGLAFDTMHSCCLAMQSKGLLRASGGSAVSPAPTQFVPTGFAKLINEYLSNYRNTNAKNG